MGYLFLLNYTQSRIASPGASRLLPVFKYSGHVQHFLSAAVSSRREFIVQPDATQRAGLDDVN